MRRSGQFAVEPADAGVGRPADAGVGRPADAGVGRPAADHG